MNYVIKIKNAGLLYICAGQLHWWSSQSEFLCQMMSDEVAVEEFLKGLTGVNDIQLTIEHDAEWENKERSQPNT